MAQDVGLGAGPLGRVPNPLAGSAARIAAGAGLVACAAVVALAAGGAGVFGGLGSLFGRDGASLQVAAGAPSADIVAAPTAAQRRVAAVRTRTAPATHHRATAHVPARTPARTPASHPAPGSGGRPSTPGPLSPAPNLPPAPPPTPSPGNGQTVASVGDSVKQVVAQAPPQLAPLTPVLGDAVDTVVQTCRGLPVCP